MELNLTQKQVQTLSPQMMQSMEILQMGSQELLEYIEEAVQENPVLEPEETYDKQDEFSVLRRKLEWLESTDPQCLFRIDGGENQAGIFTALECVERSLLGYISDPVPLPSPLGSNLVSAQRCSMVDNQRLAILIDNP